MQSQKIGISNDSEPENKTYLKEKENPEKEPLAEKDTESFYTVWKVLRDSTTLHGINHVSTEVSLFHGIFWGLLTLTMLGFLIALLVISGKQYHSYPTLTKIDEQRAKELDLPEITVCNISPFNGSVITNNSAYQDFLLLTSTVHKITNRKLNLSDPMYSSLHKERNSNWLKKSGFRIDRSFVVCQLFGDLRHCGDVFEERVTDSGLCFNFNGPSLEKSLTTNYAGSNFGFIIYMNIEQENYVLSENMGAGIKVVVHPKGTEPNMHDNAFLVSPGTSTYVSLKMVKHTFQPPPFIAFGDEVCEETNRADFRNPLAHYPDYSHYACIRECRARFIFDKCKCRMIVDREIFNLSMTVLKEIGTFRNIQLEYVLKENFVALKPDFKEDNNLGNEKICSPAEEKTCAIPKRYTFNGNCSLQTSCNCVKPCEEIEYEKEISYAHFPADVYAETLKKFGFDNVSKNYLELRVYFGSMVYKTVAQVPKLTLDGILDTTESANSVSYLGSHLTTNTDGKLVIKIYDKRDDFRFPIINFPFLDSNIPSLPGYGVYVSQLVRYSRACSEKCAFVTRAEILTSKLPNPGYSNFGGFMGIFLGASILTLTEFVEVGLFMIYITIKKMFISKRSTK